MAAEPDFSDLVRANIQEVLEAVAREAPLQQQHAAPAADVQQPADGNNRHV
jgi:hypothetical protein